MVHLTGRVLVVLVGVHVVLGLWALAGFVEWFALTPPWPRISNALFPRHVLFLQWALTLAASVLFIGGFVARWRHTPTALAGVYVAMAALCALETFAYMTGELRFVAMAAEYMAYAGIIVFLSRSGRFRVATA